MGNYGLVFFFVFGIFWVVVVCLLLDRADRKRIVQHIEGNGGRVIEILRAWGRGTRNERAYDVSFINSSGTRISAVCRSSMSGVYWISNLPPDHDEEENSTVV